VFDRRLFFAMPIFFVIVGGAADARAVTLGEAVATEQLLKDVDAMPAAERPAFIQAHRAQLNHALLVHQVIGVISHTVDVTSNASLRAYHHPLLCPTGDGDDDDDDKAQGKPGDAPNLLEMAAEFKTSLKKALNLPDGPATEAKLSNVDITDVIANQMIDEKKCTHD
jgi:hypothetical protein